MSGSEFPNVAACEEAAKERAGKAGRHVQVNPEVPGAQGSHAYYEQFESTCPGGKRRRLGIAPCCQDAADDKVDEQIRTLSTTFRDTLETVTADVHERALAAIMLAIVRGHNAKTYTYPITVPSVFAGSRADADPVYGKSVYENADLESMYKKAKCDRGLKEFKINSVNDLVGSCGDEHLRCLALYFQTEFVQCHRHDDSTSSDPQIASPCRTALSRLFGVMYGDRQTDGSGTVFWSGNGPNWVAKHQAVYLSTMLHNTATCGMTRPPGSTGRLDWSKSTGPMPGTTCKPADPTKGHVNWGSLEGGPLGYALDRLTNPTKYGLASKYCYYVSDIGCGQISWSHGKIWDKVSEKLAVMTYIEQPVVVNLRTPKYGSFFWKTEVPTLVERLTGTKHLDVVVLYGTKEACIVDELQATFYYSNRSKDQQERGLAPFPFPQPADGGLRSQCEMDCQTFVTNAVGKYPCKLKDGKRESGICVPDGTSVKFWCWNQRVDAGQSIDGHYRADGESIKDSLAQYINGVPDTPLANTLANVEALKTSLITRYKQEPQLSTPKLHVEATAPPPENPGAVQNPYPREDSDMPRFQDNPDQRTAAANFLRFVHSADGVASGLPSLGGTQCSLGALRTTTASTDLTPCATLALVKQGARKNRALEEGDQQQLVVFSPTPEEVLADIERTYDAVDEAMWATR
jgi:hypothetical protein